MAITCLNVLGANLDFPLKTRNVYYATLARVSKDKEEQEDVLIAKINSAFNVLLIIKYAQNVTNKAMG